MKNKISLRSIQGKIRLAILGTALMGSLLIAIVNIPYITITLKKNNEYNLQEFTNLAEQRIEKEIESYKDIVSLIAQDSIVSNTNLSQEKRYKELKKVAELKGFIAYGIADVNGINIQTKTDISKMPYFENVKIYRESYISSPVVYKGENGLASMIIVSAPILTNGQFDGIVFFSIDGKNLSDTVSELKFGKTGKASITDKEGVIVAHNDYNLVLEKYSAIDQAKTDKKLKPLADITQRQIESISDGKTGKESKIEFYEFEGKKKILKHTPIRGADWSLDVNFEQEEMISPIRTSIIVIIATSIITLIIGIIIAYYISSSITSPIKKSINRLKLLADGDLYSHIEDVEGHDETAMLVSSTKEIVHNLSGYIQDIIYVLSEIGEGNLMVRSQKEYYGDFKPIKEAMVKIIGQLNGTMVQINQSAQEVNDGSEAIAKGATELAQRAMEQAGIIEEFMSSTEEISNNILSSMEQVKKTSEISREAKEKASEGTEVMEQMLSAMDKITLSSKNISEIIDSINNIASQTNLLALNAAIEAARVGESGKGFTVVANEIRDLANKSTEIVKEIDRLIEECLENVENGQVMARSTSESLKGIVLSVDKTAEIAYNLLENSKHQKVSIEELVEGTRQLSEVVEMNTSTSQESAAISEELAAQSESLKQQIEMFKVN